MGELGRGGGGAVDGRCGGAGDESLGTAALWSEEIFISGSKGVSTLCSGEVGISRGGAVSPEYEVASWRSCLAMWRMGADGSG